jgi:hypothetical protein
MIKDEQVKGLMTVMSSGTPWTRRAVTLSRFIPALDRLVDPPVQRAVVDADIYGCSGHLLPAPR